MGTDRKQLYLPWADDALIPGESTYALINKLAWFSNRGPLQLIRDLKATEERPSPTTPVRLDYTATTDVWKSIATLPSIPRIHGFQLDDYVRKFSYESICGYSSSLVRNALRFCPDCISLGMHFEVLQLTFVDCCPLHKEPIASHCKECGCGISYSSNSQQGPFSCGSCNASLLQSGLESLRENLSERRRIAWAHTSLVKKLSIVPNMYYHSYSKFQRDQQVEAAQKHAMARMLDNRPRGSQQPLTLPSAYVAVKVERDKSGMPRLKRLSHTMLSSLGKQPSQFFQHSELRLSQLRVGAWAVQNFHDHIACICAARELMKVDPSRPREDVEGNDSHACSIGRGFAAWEMGQEDRARELLEESLWKAWGLSERSIRLFAFYALEKACLGSAIMRFVEDDKYELRTWQRHNFSLHLAESKFGSDFKIEQAVLCLDFDQLNLDDGCHLCDRNSDVQLQWLGDVIQKVPPQQLIQALAKEYGTGPRLARSREWMHEEINQRVRLTLKCGASPQLTPHLTSCRR